MPLVPVPTPQHVNESWQDFTSLAGVYWPRLAAAIAGGGLVGAENQIYGKPAGLRTSLLVAISCCVLTIISIETAFLYGGEPGRISAQIVTGIGFLGGGVILRNKTKVTGITTAASIFVNAGIGITVGSGFIYTGIAISLVSFGVLLLLRPLDRFIDKYPPFVRWREFDRAHKHAKHRSARVARITRATISPKPGEEEKPL